MTTGPTELGQVVDELVVNSLVRTILERFGPDAILDALEREGIDPAERCNQRHLNLCRACGQPTGTDEDVCWPCWVGT